MTKLFSTLFEGENILLSPVNFSENTIIKWLRFISLPSYFFKIVITQTYRYTTGEHSMYISLSRDNNLIKSLVSYLIVRQQSYTYLPTYKNLQIKQFALSLSPETGVSYLTRDKMSSQPQQQEQQQHLARLSY